MAEPHSSNFRVITTIFWVSEYLGILQYIVGANLRSHLHGNFSMVSKSGHSMYARSVHGSSSPKVLMRLWMEFSD